MTTRVANLSLTASGSGKILNVAVPSKPSEKELAMLAPSIIGVIGKGTNCNTCLSGVVRVVLEEEAAATVQVNLAG
jgi:hypothetical protein